MNQAGCPCLSASCGKSLSISNYSSNPAYAGRLLNQLEMPKVVEAPQNIYCILATVNLSILDFCKN